MRSFVVLFVHAFCKFVFDKIQSPLTFAASVVFNPGFFFIHTDFVLVFTDALVGDIVVVAEWF